MAGYVLSLYPDFSCIADRCPATCCSGWKITVDQESYQRFSQLTDEKLRQDILGNLVEQDGKFRFANQKNGDCAMLDADGLCRIQRNTREEMLCNTCRKYPRITAKIPGQKSGTESSLYQDTAQNQIIDTASQDDILWLSLAASCPVVAEYILDGRVSWLWLEESGQWYPLSPMQWERIRRVTAMAAGDEWVTVFWDATVLFDAFVDLALDVLDILVRFPEMSYLEQSFDLYDVVEPDLTVFGNFFAETGSSWHSFVQQYQCYRYPSRYLELPEENGLERTRQIQGELLLMRIMLCSRYVLRGDIERKDWLEILHWVYRFSAHGQVMAEQVHALFSSIKPDWLQMANQNICLQK